MLLAGFGHTDITPVPTPAAPEFEVFDAISFRATVLRQGDEAVAILSGDFFSFEEHLLEQTCDELADIAWLPRRNILVSVSHTGGVPVLYQSYVAQPCPRLRAFGEEARFVQAAAAAVRQAAQSLEPVRAGFGSAAAAGVHYNRRSHDAHGNLVMSNFMLPYPRPELRYGPVDENVYVLRFDHVEDAYLPGPRGALIAFGCHALCSKDKIGHISADYPGAVRRVVESAWPGAAVGFVPGAIANVVPFHRAGRTYQCVGNAVGGAALYALERTATRPDLKLSVTQRVIRVSSYAPLSLPDAIAACNDDTDGSQRMNVYAARRAAAAAEFDYPITVVRLGDCAIVHLRGEVFVETARAIQDSSSTAMTIVLSGPSADIGYLCPPHAVAEGGMEPSYTAVAPQAEAAIRQAACELVAEGVSAVGAGRAP